MNLVTNHPLVLMYLFLPYSKDSGRMDDGGRVDIKKYYCNVLLEDSPAAFHMLL